MKGLFGLYLMKNTEASKQAAQGFDGPATLLMNDAIALAPSIPGLTIGRLYRPKDFAGSGRGDYNPATDPQVLPPGIAFERGQQWARRLLPDFGACKATMSVNEPIFTKQEVDPERRRRELKATAAFEAGWTVEMHARGKATVIFNLADGNGEPEDLAVLLTEFYYWLKQGPDPGGEIYLGAHVYGASETGWLDDDMSRALYHAYRATERWLPYLAQQGIKCPPIIFTEAGTEGGWRHRRDAVSTGQDYLRFADKMIRSNNVEAIILYCHEPLDPEWIPWDIAGTEIVDMAAQWNREHVYRKAIWQEGQGGQVMPENYIELWLRDMWARAGVPAAQGDSVFAWCVEKAKQTGKVYVPQPASGGSYQNWMGHPRYVVCYMYPGPLYFEKDVWEVKEGFPPL